MKPGSSLNPYAASYTPLSKRGAVDEPTAYALTAKDSKTGMQPAWMGHQRGPGIIAPSAFQQFPQNNVHASQGSSSQTQYENVEKQAMDDNCDMDLAYLQMSFPDISDDSLSNVYMANNGDLEATVDMINDLEEYNKDTLGLPETLDIGDVLESGSSSEPSSQKNKNVGSAETSTSSGS